MRSSALGASAALVCLGLVGCFEDAPSLADDETSGSTSATTGGTIDVDADGSDAPSDVDDSGGPSSSVDSSDDGDTTTGNPVRGCGDGMFEVGEICPGEVAAWTRALELDIVDVDVGTFDDTPGDGIVLGWMDEDIAMQSWTWGGEPVGPQLGFVTVLETMMPLGVRIANLDDVPGDDAVIVGSTAFYRQLWLDDAPSVAGPCAIGDDTAAFAVGQFDDDPGDELLLAPGNAMPVARAALGLGSKTPCDLTDDDMTHLGKAKGVASIDRDGLDPDDVALAVGGVVVPGTSTDPFPIEWGDGFTPDSMIAAIHGGDLDGDGVRDDILLDTETGFVVAIWNDGVLSAQVAVLGGGNVVDAALGDLDSDGDDDVVVADASSDRVGILRNDAGTLVYLEGPMASAPVLVVAVDDVDDDSMLDIIVGTSERELAAFVSTP